MQYKKLLASVLSAAMVLATMVVPAFADDSSISSQEEFENALNNLADGDTLTLAAGEYVLPTTVNVNDVTFKGAGKEETKINVSEKTELKGAGLKIKDLSFSINKYIPNGTLCMTATDAEFKNVKFSGVNIGNSIGIAVSVANATSTTTFDSCDFDGTYRGIQVWSLGGKLNIKKCDFNSPGYPFNIDAGTGTVVVEESVLSGWTSYTTTIKSVSFKNCEFVKRGDYDVIASYTNTIFEDCTFDDKFDAYSQNVVAMWAFFDCEKNGTPITNDNVGTLLPGIINDDGDIKIIKVKIDDTYYSNLADAAAAAQNGDTVTLLADAETDQTVVFDKNITLDLNGHTFTSNYEVSESSSYAVTFNNGGTITDSADNKGELVANKARAVYAKGDMLYVKDAKIRVSDQFARSGQAVVATTAGLNMTNSTVIGEFDGSYAVCSFGTNEEYTIADSVITGTTVGIYRNGSVGEFEATVENTEITVNGDDNSEAVYISNNVDNPKNHIVMFKDCTITGKTAVEIKYTDLTLDNCNVTATEKNPVYIPNNNGGTAGGFAVVLSDNSKKGETITPRGTIIIKGNGEYTGLIGLESIEEAKNYMGTNVTDVKVSGGTFSTDVSDYCEEGYSAKLIGGKYVVDETADKIALKFVQTDDKKVYDIVLSGDGQDINRLNTADFTFAIDNSKITYTLAAAEKMSLTPTDDPNRYEFHFNGKTGVTTEDTGAEIKIGTVTFDGYGKFKFSVENADTNLVTATTKGDNLVTEFVVTAAAAGQGTLVINDAESVIDTELTVPTNKLTVNITFPNAIGSNDADYQQMKATIAGGDHSEEIALGETENGAYKIEKDLAENTPYTVTVSGEGYRTTRYTVTLNSDKILNFWNNAKDNAAEVEAGNPSSAKNVTFLAGDIVKDNEINIYDLSAVVSYFGMDNLVSAHPEYAKYDLNRDGKIDSKDVAYVLVSWGK